MLVEGIAEIGCLARPSGDLAELDMTYHPVLVVQAKKPSSLALAVIVEQEILIEIRLTTGRACPVEVAVATKIVGDFLGVRQRRLEEPVFEPNQLVGQAGPRLVDDPGDGRDLDLGGR